jgi:hypothetical protein
MNFPTVSSWPPHHPSRTQTTGVHFINLHIFTFLLGDKFHPWRPGVKLWMALRGLMKAWVLTPRGQLITQQMVALVWIEKCLIIFSLDVDGV